MNVVEQLQSAPVAADGPDAGRAVDGAWEHEYGHALAALRYGAMSRPAPTPMPLVDEDVDERTWMQRELLRNNEEAFERGGQFDRDRYVWR